MTRQQRSEWSREMLMAYRHNVPSNLLTSFIAKNGTPTQAALEDKSYRAPGFSRKRPRKDL